MSSSTPRTGALTEWLRIMLGEVARKQEEAARAAAERQLRQEAAPPGPALKTAAGKRS